MPRYIDADKLLDLIRDHDAQPRYGYLDLWDIEDAPTEDVQPVVHGKWIKNDIPNSELSKCTNCGYDLGTWSFKYCPFCGAKMDKKEATYIKMF